MKNSKGQTLLEILLAFSIAIMVLSSIVVGVATSLSNAQYTKNQNAANAYAKEGMAIVRQLRDSSWSDFSKKTGTFCVVPNSTTLVADDCSSNAYTLSKGIFARSIVFDRSDPGTSDCAGVGPSVTPAPNSNSTASKVTVTVAWADNKCPAGSGNPRCHKVELITCFSNSDQKLLP